MIRLVRGEVRPVPVRERLERMLEKARADLESAERRAERIRERIAKLDDLIASTTDPGRLETLRDLRYLAELDLAVAEAKIARDRFAVEMLEKQLVRLEAGEG
jgi:chromosome segregation ATPase